MPNWWLQWAERIALILADWWMRSRAGEGKGPGSAAPDRDAEPGPDAMDPPPTPGADSGPR